MPADHIYHGVGLIQIETKKGQKKTLEVVQAFGPDLKNNFKTQMAEKEIYSHDWGVELEMLQFARPEKKGLRPLLFAAANKNKDEYATKIGAAVFIDVSQYPRVKTWDVGFFLGFNEVNGKCQILIQKSLKGTFTQGMLTKEQLDKGADVFDLIPDVKYEDLQLNDLGEDFVITEKAKNYLVFSKEEEPKPLEESNETSAVAAIAESIVAEEEKEKELNPVEEAMALHGLETHRCTVAIVEFLHSREGQAITRPMIVSYMKENYEWSESTVRRKLGKLERSEFLVDLPGQNTTKEYKVVGFNLAFAQKLKELCENKGWKFTQKKLS